ncbi:MAG: AbrB/MazE/SpoVT family DNA-binding domain-containing protein [Firmicutes bacterium]|nr:AbrB/MazE/SpoVT family DNA-binding domain-containing protein [Bacillota bacterium]
MKATGIVRKIDELGRIVLPIELRRTLDIQLHDPLEIFLRDDAIVLRKYQVSCVFCGSHENLTTFRKKTVCESCLKELAALESERVGA